jgi:hypothetical protein
MSMGGCSKDESGRGDWIRTNDPLLPKQVRYQAALRPDSGMAASLCNFSTPERAIHRHRCSVLIAQEEHAAFASPASPSLTDNGCARG